MTRRLELGIVAAVVIADQVTKLLVAHEMELYESVPVIPGLLNLTHIRNSGVAFGLLNSAEFAYKPVIMAVIALAALVGVALYASQLPLEHKWARGGLALILGGARATSSISWTSTGEGGTSGPSTSRTRQSRSASDC